MKYAIVYHRIDWDGLCSYAVLGKYVRHQMREEDSLISIGWNHGDNIPDLSGLDIIFVADISFPPTLMKQLAEESRLVWIDHHKTSIDASIQFGYSGVPGLRRIGVGACELCWKYAFPKTKVPFAVKLLSCYDVFDKKRIDWEGATLPFQYGIRNRYGVMHPDGQAFVFSELFDEKVMENTYPGILSEGRNILSYIRQCGKRSCKAYGFEVTLAGRIKALCLMTAEFGSIPMEESARERGCEVVINVNRLSDDFFKVSCYAAYGQSPIDLGRYLLSTYVNGGGHHNAAGCLINRDQFIKLITENVL